MKLEVGQFVRTKDGKIGKYFGEKAYEPNKIAIWTNTTKEGIKVTPVIDKNTIVKASYNIIDILEEGDYVNGLYINSIDKEEGTVICYTATFFEEDIMTIITKEQMEQMEYKVDG